METSFVSKKFFATCCVIVEAPSNLLFWEIFLILLITALNIPFASIPGWLKKFLSSADRNAFTILSGIDSKGMNNLFCFCIDDMVLLVDTKTCCNYGHRN